MRNVSRASTGVSRVKSSCIGPDDLVVVFTNRRSRSNIHQDRAMVPYSLVKGELDQSRNLQVGGVPDSIDWFNTSDKSVRLFAAPVQVSRLNQTHQAKATRHPAIYNVFVHVHKYKKPVALTLPFLQLSQEVCKEQPGRCGVEAMRLNVSYLLLIDCFQPFRGLPSHIVSGYHPRSMTWVAVEHRGAPSSQTAEIICFVFHVSHQLAASKCGCPPRLIMRDHLVCVVSGVCTNVWNIVT